MPTAPTRDMPTVRPQPRPQPRQRPLPWRRWLRWRWLPLVGAVVVAAAALLLYLAQREAKQVATDSQGVASVAVQEKVDLGRDVAAACERGDVVQTPQGQDLCERASAAAAQPVPAPAAVQGERGGLGPEGRGITNTDVNDSGDLVVYYSDGTSQNVGHVVGPDPPPGRGIAASGIADGHLVLTYTDGQRVDLGQVVGRDGTDGDDGADSTVAGPAGRGIADVDQVDDRLVIYYDDGSTDDVGPLPIAEPPEQTTMWCPPGESPGQVTYGIGGETGTACVTS